MSLTLEQEYSIPSYNGDQITVADRAPLNWKGWSLLAADGRDSIVGTLWTESGEGFVVKWNKREIPVEDIPAAAQYTQKAIELYKAALGEEYILPTLLAIGEKSDSGPRYKLYTIQPYTEAWTARNLPEELSRNPGLLRKWHTLYSRIARLYRLATVINSQVCATKSGVPYPLALRIGQLWGLVYRGIENPPLVKSPNILITRPGNDIKLCDFGTTTPWKEEMNAAYTQILKEAVKGGEFYARKVFTRKNR